MRQRKSDTPFHCSDVLFEVTSLPIQTTSHTLLKQLLHNTRLDTDHIEEYSQCKD